MSWQQIQVQLPQAYAEQLGDKFSDELDALAVTYQDASDTPIFEPDIGTTPLWEQTKVTALYNEDQDIGPIVDSISSQVTKVGGQISVTGLADEIWERVWLKHFKPIRFGQKTWVCPTHISPPEPDAVNIILDPGLAFGTGTHPTTALCLTWLDRHQDQVKSKKALDFGCGSGILAIAALKHGAANAVGIDIDPQAITASIENTQTNQIAENQFKAYLPDDAPTQTYDLVMANILKGPLIELCDLICGQINKGGQLILSGLLEAQVSEIVKNYEKHLKIENIETKEGWALVYGIKL